MAKKLLIILLLITTISAAQTELLPTIAWRTNVSNVEQLTDSTYKFDVFPLDWNEPSAATMQIGNYFQDFAGNTYQVIDSTYLSITVWDIFETGVSPQVNQVGIIYESPTGSEYLAPIRYQMLDESALDNARARELAYLWRHANLYAQDSAYLVWWNDTIIDISTKYDIDTLHQKTIDSLLIHRTEIDELKNSSIELDFATVQEALIGIDSFKIISPLINAQVDSLNNVPYKGALENIYTDYSISADSLFSNWGLIDSIVSEYYKATGTVIINEFSDDHTLSGNSDSVLVTERAIKQFVQNSIQGGVVYLGSWNANTNTPTIANSTGNLGDMYAVSVTGTQDLGSGSITYTSGGFVIHNGTIWEYIGTDAMVASVNAYTGAVELWPVLAGDKLTIRGNTTGINIGDATSVSGNTSAITTINNTLSTHNTRIIALEGLDIIEFSDTTIIATRYDMDTLVTGVYSEITDLNDYIDIHRILIDANSGKDTTGIYHHNRQFLDSLSYATLQDVLIGVDTSKIITPFIAAQRDSLLNVPYSGAIENIYTDYNFTADSIFANYFNIDFDSLQITVSQITDLPIQVINETPTGTINGTNDTFSTAYNFISGTTEVYLNGVLQIISVNYTEGSGQIIFNAGFEPYTGDYLTINYIR